MKKVEVLKAVVILQAICMIVLAAVVVVKLVPLHQRPLDDADQEAHEEAGDDSSYAVATVGGEKITAAQISEALHKKYGDEVLRTMMVRKAIDLEAENQGLQITAEEQQAELASITSGYASEDDYFQVMKEQLGLTKDEVLEDLRYRLLLEEIAIGTVAVSDEELDEYVEAHKDEYGDRLQLHLRWIVTTTEDNADKLLARLAAGEDFKQLAEAASIDSFTSGNGGDLGFIDANDPFYNKEILDTASRLQTGEMAGPFKVDAGFAVIQLIERQLTEGLTDDEIREKVGKQLALAKARSLRDIEDGLLEKYNAVVNP